MMNRSAPAAAIMLGESRPGLGPPRGGNVAIKLCVRVGDADAHCSRARQFGARPEEWGAVTG